MADNERRSRADDLFEILNEFGDNPQATEVPKEEAVAKASPPAEEVSQNEEIPLEDAVSAPEGDEMPFDEVLNILNSRYPDSESEIEEPAEPEEEDISELPTSIFSHLTEESESDISQAAPENPLLSHFTETDGEPVSEIDDEDELEDNIPFGETKIGRVLGFFKGMTFVPKAIIYVLLVAIASAYLSYFIVTIGNDVFALVTDTGEVKVTITEGMTHEDVGKLLAEKGIIDYPWVFELYMEYRGDGDSSNEYIIGDHTLKKEHNYSQLITSLTTEAVNREIVRVTIPEGYTVNQIIDLLVEKGVGQREDYLYAINEYPYKWEFVKQLDEMLAVDKERCEADPEYAAGASISDRIYRLEGYLYPDTYDFYTTEDEVYVINKMLAAFNERFWKDFTYVNDAGESYQNTMAEEYGLNFDDVIVLASMAQSEGGNAEDYYYISYVFHNRLKVDTGKPLHKMQSDATIQYLFDKRLDSEEIDISYDSPYNSYIYEGLPPGAISNPGMDALSAALFPAAPPVSPDSEKTIDAYYFVSNKAGKTYFAATESGHNKNREQVDKDNKKIEAGEYDG